jgi:hypothetical protein
MTTCITTFSKDGYDLYGHRMIESWIKYWPINDKLLVYTEGFDIIETDPRVCVININDTCVELNEFKEQSQTMLSGVVDKREISKIQKTVKWSHKVFVIGHALKDLTEQFLIFLDGDTYTIEKIEDDLAHKLVNDHLIAVHFERLAKYGLHFETGLLVFNKTHKQMPLFESLYTSGYKNLDIYKLKKTWDSFWLVSLYEKYNLDVYNLSKKQGGVFSNPLISKKLIHDVGTGKYLRAGYNKFTGKKNA